MTRERRAFIADLAFVAAVLYPVLVPQVLDAILDKTDTTAVTGPFAWALELVIMGPALAQRMLGGWEWGFALACAAPMLIMTTTALALRIASDIGPKGRWLVWAITLSRHALWALAAGGFAAYFAGPAGWALSAAPLLMWATLAWAIEAVKTTRAHFFEAVCAMTALEHILWPGAVSLWLLVM